MDQIAARTIAIFQARADSVREVGLDTRLPDLDIAPHDLALILLDVEDAFGVDFRYDPQRDEADAFATVGRVVERARRLIEIKRAGRLRDGLARSKSLWLVSSRNFA
jgi:hypothetical protein